MTQQASMSLFQVLLDDTTELLALLERGNRIRATAETKCNQYSSRSHAVFIVTITFAFKVARIHGVLL